MSDLDKKNLKGIEQNLHYRGILINEVHLTEVKQNTAYVRFTEIASYIKIAYKNISAFILDHTNYYYYYYYFCTKSHNNNGNYISAPHFRDQLKKPAMTSI